MTVRPEGDTPRTDAGVRMDATLLIQPGQHSRVDWPTLCGQLERELAAATAQLQAAQRDAERNAKAVEGLRRRLQQMVGEHSANWGYYENAAKQALRWLESHQSRSVAAIAADKEPPRNG